MADAIKKVSIENLSKFKSLLDGSATIASVSEGVVTLKAGVTEADGIVSNSSGSDITLAKVATTGTAADIAVVDAAGKLTADNVEAALAELADASAGGTASKTVYITETAGSGSDAFSKRYGIYQGSTGSSASPVVGEKLADIDIPKDMVVESGSVVDITYNSEDGKLYEGATDVTAAIKGTGTASASDAGKYIKLIIANSSATALYIKATDLVDIYTAEQNATQIQLAIDSNNVISATVVAGSIDTTELAAGAVTTAKIADDAVTADKIAITAHSESQTAGADGLAISVTTTDGQVSAVSASIAANTYDAYGAASSAASSANGYTDSAIAALDATESQTAGTDGLALSVTEVDGVITSISGSIAANTYDSYGAASSAAAGVVGASGDASSANTIYGAKAYADDVYNAIQSYTDAEIEALFE